VFDLKLASFLQNQKVGFQNKGEKLKILKVLTIAAFVLVSGSLAKATEVDCNQRFGIYLPEYDNDSFIDDSDVVVLGDISHRDPLVLDAHMATKLSFVYRLNSSQNWKITPRPGAKVVVNGRSGAAHVQKGGVSHVLFVEPINRRGGLNVNVRTRGLPRGDAQCQIVVPFVSVMRGAVLYSDSDGRGRSVEITEDVANMSFTAIGNDRLSSLTVEAGCTVTLFEDIYFRGRSMTFRGPREVPFLGYMNDETSSIRIDCR
jgi:hypothetical protein